MKKDKKKIQQPAKTAVIPQKKIPVWLLPAILVVTLIVFYPALNNDLIYTWDDGLNITDNHLTAKLNTENVKGIFTQDVGNNYNPLPVLAFAVIRSQVGLKPFLYHLVNVMLHLVCVALVFQTTKLLTKKPFVIGAVTLLFAIHPMRVESVAWITELKDVMFASFYFGALIAYIKWIRKPGKQILLYVLMLVLAVLSMLSKIQAVSLPLSMLLIDYLEKRPLKFKLILEKIPFFLLSAATGITGIYFLKTGDSLIINEAYPLTQRILFGCYSLGSYIVRLFAPINLSAYYPYPVRTDGMLPTLYYITPVLLIAGVVWVIIKYRSNRIVIFGLLFFFFNVMFVLQVVGAGKAFMAERFTYVPYFGLFFIAATSLQNLSEQKKNLAFFGKSVFAAYALVFAVLSYQRCLVWKNNETLWKDNVKKYPNSDVGYDNLGVHYRNLKENDKAMENYNKVLAINPKYALTYNNRGNIYFERGQDDLALADYNKAIELDAKKVTTYANRALIYCRKNEYAKAEEDFAKAQQLDSTFARTYFNRGILYDVEGKYQKAVDDFTKYLNLVPTDDGIYNSRGIAYQKMGKQREAVADFSKAIEMMPKEPIYWENRSHSYNLMGEKEAAKKDALKAKQMGRNFDPAYLKQLGIE
jgi:tetratricopeptide (TPR) repeat protein